MMIDFIVELKDRNEVLFWYGILCFVFSLLFLGLTQFSSVEVYQVNAWFKPFKFAFSTFTFVWAMAWYCWYLPTFNIKLFSWTVIVLLSFEIIYIALMAMKGKASHFNVSTPFYAMMFSLMAIAASLVTMYTAYVGFLFFTHSFPSLAPYYVWSIRWAISLFVVFAFQGFLMGARMSHTVGLVNNNSNLFILAWSKLAGDLRIAHFVGMHALQVLPILSFYFLKNTKYTFLVSALYALLALFTLVQALNGKSVFGVKAKMEST
jgi:hypothetical protein